MRWMCVLALAAPAGACASAGGSSAPPIDGAVGDGTINNPIDGSLIDAAPVPVTLSQNASTAVTGGSFACVNTGNNRTRENSYYRVFPLADHGVPGSLEVKMVSFAVESAVAGAGTSQAAQVKIGRYAGIAGTQLDLTMITPINAAAVQIPNGNGTTVTVPITGVLPPGSNLVVELAIPDGDATGNQFFIGTNAAGETKPGYIRAPTCTVNAPVGMNALGMAQNPPLPKADMVITVAAVKY